MFKSIHGYSTLGLLLFALIASGIWYVSAPLASEAEKMPEDIHREKTLYVRTGEYVLANLDTMSLELHNGTTTLETIALVSRGKPGSYYETIGGSYPSDYKEISHFSSIGHVYMPYSIHIFGNYFIHGIPYYPDGTKVSSTYSGGCIRLADEDAKRVYAFVKKGTPIIIVRGDDVDFIPTETTTQTRKSSEMTTLMVATISLEVLTQDNEITDTDGVSTTTRRTLLPRLLNGEATVAPLYAKAVGEEAFLSYMNQKARTLGMTSTSFVSISDPVETTDEDAARFMKYIDTYKSYLRTAGTVRH